jgi:enoyl-CoA hydratase
VVDDGTAVDAALALARSIAASPWACVVADRASVYDGLGLSEAEALAVEAERGRAIVLSPDFQAGVDRFGA